MAAYIRQQKKTKKLTDGKKRKRSDGESKEAHKARKEEKRRRKEERDLKRRERELKKAVFGSRKGDKDRDRDIRAESSRSGRRLVSEERDTPKRSSLPAREDRADSKDRRRAGDEPGGSRARYDERDDRRSRDRDRERDEGRYRSLDRDVHPRDRPVVPKRVTSPRLDERDRDRHRDEGRRDDRDRRRYDEERHERRPRDDERGGRNGDDRYSRR